MIPPQGFGGGVLPSEMLISTAGIFTVYDPSKNTISSTFTVKEGMELGCFNKLNIVSGGVMYVKGVFSVY
jgi:hypothetical protein